MVAGRREPLREGRQPLSCSRAGNLEAKPKLSSKELSSLLVQASLLCGRAAGEGKTRSQRAESLIAEQRRRLDDQESHILTLQEENTLLKKRLRSHQPAEGPSTPAGVPSAAQTPASRTPASTPLLRSRASSLAPPKPSDQDPAVQIPGFVRKRLAPLYQRGGLEELSDESFDRRHSKKEAEEKKLIRRDKARQKEAELRARLINSPRYLAYTQWLPQTSGDGADGSGEESEEGEGTPRRLPVRYRDEADVDLSRLHTVLIVPSLPARQLTKKRLALTAGDAKTPKAAR